MSIGLVDGKAGILYRLKPCAHGKLGEPVHAPGILAIDINCRVKTFDFSGEPDFHVGCIE